MKQLITTATLSLIQDIPNAIYYIYAILDFNMLAQYLLYNNKTFLYIDHTLYRLDKTKIAFKNHCPIDTKLF